MTSIDNAFNIKPNEEYASLVPPLSISEYELLKEDIKQNGVQLPIVTNQDGDILDGHHRYKIWVVDLGRSVKDMPKPTIMRFNDKLQEKLFVINANLKRRQLNDFQKAELGVKRESILKEVAKQNIAKTIPKKGQKGFQSISTSSTTPSTSVAVATSSNELPIQKIGPVADNIAKSVNLSPATYKRAKFIIQKGSEEQKQNLRNGKARIHTIYKFLTHAQKRNEMILEARSSKLLDDLFKDNPDRIKLLLGDFREQSKQIPDNSVDLIFTDPPYYTTADLPFYGELAKLAARVLRPGGNLVVYSGHHFIIDAGHLIKESSDHRLKFVHQHIILHSGQREVLFAYNIGVRYKPLLWFVKDVQSPNDSFVSYTEDVIPSDPVAKEYHKWQQSPVEADYMISNLTVENQVVLDPFLGGAKTAIAALKLNRKFIGIEIKEDIFNIAKGRIAESLSSKYTNKSETEDNKKILAEYIEENKLIDAIDKMWSDV